MPKRETRTQDSSRSTKSQRSRREPESQSCVDVSSTNLSSGDPTNPLSDPQTNVSADLSENDVTDTLMDSSKEPCIEHPTDTSKDPSTNLLKGSSTDPAQDRSKDKVTDLSVKSFETSSTDLDKKLFTTVTHPFNHPHDAHLLERSYHIPSLSITTTNIAEFNRNPIFEHYPEKYPVIHHLAQLARNYMRAVIQFPAHLVNRDNERIVDADEINRVQQVFEEFGQRDPNFAPDVLVERLANLNWRTMTMEYITSWALTTNIAVDGDIRYTLLPPRVVALSRDIDCHSSDTHRILFNRWIQLTFGLLAGGHTAYQNSSEALQRIDHVRRFITKLIGPYCVQHDGYGHYFSEELDEILHLAVALGYHLMGVAEQYRWDWTWLAPASKELGRLKVGEPPPRRPREEEVPEGIWITAPALVKETNEFGQQLAIEITLVAASQSHLYPAPLIAEHWDQEAEDEYERMKQAITLDRY